MSVSSTVEKNLIENTTVEKNVVENTIVEKNQGKIVCKLCKTVALSANVAAKVNVTDGLVLPIMTKKREDGKDFDKYTVVWSVDDPWAFDNITVCRPSKDGIVYLACGECEIGPIGAKVHNTLYYIAPERLEMITVN